MNGKLHKISITRRFQIAAGHRVYGHENRCGSVHGHNFLFHITCEAPDLDSIGRVIDFSVIKNKIGGWLDSNWDHAMLLFKDDPIADLWREGLHTEGAYPPLKDHKHFILPNNPTVENLCSYLLKVSNELMIDTEIKVIKVVGWETENCSCEVTL